ncbi:MAG: hypothetical protein UHD09_01965 [Bifidobacterium sp.]|nr:hypothetical protein [Bifidobacterium sp.]
MSANRNDNQERHEGGNATRIVAIVIVVAMLVGCAVPFILAGL